MTEHDDNVVVPRFPVTCPHGVHVGWALSNEPTTVTDTRFCAPCEECIDEQNVRDAEATDDDWMFDPLWEPSDASDA